MHAATAARRVPALAVVVGAHALALAFLLELTRTHPTGRSAEESLTLIALLPATRRERDVAPPSETPALPSEPPTPETRSSAIDWAAEGADAAARVARGEDNSHSARAFGVPPPSAMFDPAPVRRPGLAWNHARTHRVEALPGGVTVFNLNDHCAVALLWVVP